MNKKFLLIISILAISIVACKKDDDSDDNNTPAPVPLTNTQKLASGPWQITAATVDPPLDFGFIKISDVYDLIFEPCAQDDLAIFNEDGTGNNDQGALKCEPDEPQTEDFNWSFVPGANQIAIDFLDGTVDTLDVEFLSEIEARFFVEDSLDGVFAKVTLVATHP